VRLDHGRLVADGPTAEVVHHYEEEVRARVDAEHGPSPVVVESVELSSGAIAPDDPLRIEAVIDVQDVGDRWALQLRLRDRVAWDDEELAPGVDDDVSSRSIRTVVSESITATVDRPGRWRLVGTLERVPLAPMLADVVVVALDRSTGTVLSSAQAVLEVMGERTRTEPLIAIDWALA
jgi:hypothetical protein